MPQGCGFDFVSTVPLLGALVSPVVAGPIPSLDGFDFSLLPLPLPSGNTGAVALLPVCSCSGSAEAICEISSAPQYSRPYPANLSALATDLVSASSTRLSASLASLWLFAVPYPTNWPLLVTAQHLKMAYCPS